MVAVIILCLLAVFFAWLESTGRDKHGLKISFGLIFIFLAIRYNFGNDYQSYYTIFKEIANSSKINFNYESSHGRGIEIGWILLNWLLGPFGFFGLIIFTSFIYCYCYYNFFISYVPKNYYWLSVLIFIFNPAFLLIQLSAMRQSIAIIVILVSFKYIYTKKIVPFVICVCVAFLFHQSALFVLPAFLLGLFNWKINKYIASVLMIFFLLFLYYINLIVSEFSNIISIFFNQYENYYQAQGEIDFGSGVGMIYQSLMFFLVLFYFDAQKDKPALMFKIAIVYFFIVPLGLIMIMTSRINYYFQPAILAAFPIIINSIKLKFVKIAVILIIIAFAYNSFIKFVDHEVQRDAYSTYQTIFSASLWY